MLPAYYRFVAYNGGDEDLVYDDGARLQVNFTPWKMTGGAMAQGNAAVDTLLLSSAETLAQGVFVESGNDYDNTSNLYMGFTGTFYVKGNVSNILSGLVSLYLEKTPRFASPLWPSESSDALSTPPTELIHLGTADMRGNGEEEVMMVNIQFNPRTSINTGTMKPPLGTPLEAAHPLAKGLVGCWLQNEGSGNIVQDLSGNGNTATLMNDAHFVPGKFGSAVDFDGTGDYVTTTIDVGTTMYVSLWVKINADTGNKVIFTWQNSTSQTLIMWTGRWDLIGTGFDIFPVSPTPVLGQWHHVVAGFEAGVAAYLYVDGVEIGKDTTIGTPATVANFRWGGTNTAGIDGQIDHILLYNRVLTADEVAQLYREPFAIVRREPYELWSPAAVGGVMDSYFYRRLLSEVV